MFSSVLVSITLFGGFYKRKVLTTYQKGLRINYRPQRSWGKVIFSEACVKNSVRGGGSAPLHAGIHPPPGPEAGTPPGTRGRHPQTRGRHPPTRNRIRHPPGPEAGTPWDQTPPRPDTPRDQTPPNRGRHLPPPDQR